MISCDGLALFSDSTFLFMSSAMPCPVVDVAAFEKLSVWNQLAYFAISI